MSCVMRSTWPPPRPMLLVCRPRCFLVRLQGDLFRRVSHMWVHLHQEGPQVGCTLQSALGCG